MKWTLVILLSSLSTGHQLQGCSVSAEVGETVILPVKVDLAKDSELSAPTIMWKNEAEEVVHQYRNKQDYNGSQNKRFKTRTSLFKGKINNGNVSLKIINVTKYDAGKYTCVVLHKDPPIDKTYNVTLCVEEKDEQGGPQKSQKPAQKHGLTPEESTKPEKKPVRTPVIVAIAIGVFIALAALTSFFLYKKCKERAQGDDQDMDTLTGGAQSWQKQISHSIP